MSFFAVLACVGTAFYFAGRKVSLAADYTYYLLLSEGDGAIEAAAREDFLSGGSGCVYAGKSVLAYYPAEDAAETVRARLTARGEAVSIARVGLDAVVLRGKEKRDRALWESGLSAVDGTLALLYQVANGLERAALGQREGKAALQTAIGTLRGLDCPSEGERYPELWHMAQTCADALGRAVRGTLLAREVRAAATELCLAFSALDD